MFAATVVNNQYIYTFGGMNYNGKSDSIDRYDIANDEWEQLDFKLNSADYGFSCFSPEPNKVVVISGGETNWGSSRC